MMQNTGSIFQAFRTAVLAGNRFVCMFIFISAFFCKTAVAQTPRTYTSSEILLQIKKLNVLGSVLYIAAHPDDENTRLLGYLANEKLYRTGYLSLTRGDGGQNLIGDEQGVDLGLIRTQELIAARRIDGAEQFFSRAYDFGYSKSPEEAIRIWGHDKILSDVVWVIRKFKPDVIICRFPTTGEGGHGHHTASAILAKEAFDAAADPKQFPGQLANGVVTWQAKRLLWNTFNFGGTNTQKEDQFKMDVGGYNALLGKSYGEMAALSRSQHKSQGFGVPAQRGTTLEYFATIAGDRPVDDLLQGVNTSWKRVAQDPIREMIETITRQFDPEHPDKSVPALVKLYSAVEKVGDPYWKTNKLAAIQQLIESCSGLFMEAVSESDMLVMGDSARVTMTVNNRLGVNIASVSVRFNDIGYTIPDIQRNQNASIRKAAYIPMDDNVLNVTQPYWLTEKMDKGSFNVKNQELIGNAQNEPPFAEFSIIIEGRTFTFRKPVMYKFTDPVKGELYQPVCITTPVTFTTKTPLLIARSLVSKTAIVEMTAYRKITLANPALHPDLPAITNNMHPDINLGAGAIIELEKNQKKVVEVPVKPGVSTVGGQENSTGFNKQLRTISYDHIPVIHYFKPAVVECKVVDVKIAGSSIGYIPGAGDKVPEALEQMGYKVTMLKENDITAAGLAAFDAVVTGIRAYNTNDWMNNVYDVLMQYVQKGGVLLVQYNTSNQIGPVKARIAPYPFTITRNRITDEEEAVNILVPQHPVFNYPNTITANDFEGWIQERSVYHAETADSNYTKLISMKDPGEKEHDGSLVVANYGKGRFIYTGISFFRQLPAGVAGAYRLFANLVAGRNISE